MLSTILLSSFLVMALYIPGVQLGEWVVVEASGGRQTVWIHLGRKHYVVGLYSFITLPLGFGESRYMLGS